MKAKKGAKDLAIIVDSCGFSRLGPEERERAYTPYSVILEQIRGPANGNGSAKFMRKLLNAISEEKESEKVAGSEDYMQIRSFVWLAYDDAVITEQQIIGLNKPDFVDSLSGLLYTLKYGREENCKPVRSITISCANKNKDREAFRKEVISSLKPMVDLKVFKDLKVEYDEGKGEDIIMLVNTEAPEDSQNIGYALKNVRDFSEKFNSEKKQARAKKEIENMRTDRKYGSLVDSTENVAYFMNGARSRVIGDNNSEESQNMRRYSAMLRRYEPLLAKNIVQETVIESDMKQKGYKNRREFIEAMVSEALEKYESRLAQLSINLPEEAEDALCYNIARVMISEMSNREGNGRMNNTSTDVDVVATAYAVGNQIVEIMSDDTDVIELATYSMHDSNLPSKRITLNTSRSMENPALSYLNRITHEDAYSKEAA